MMADKQAEDSRPESSPAENAHACSHCFIRKTVREEKLRSALLQRLNCVEGQIRGIKGLVEKDAYSDDVLTQIAAARSALTSISKIVLENHIHGCLMEKIRSGEADVVDELLQTIGRLL